MPRGANGRNSKLFPQVSIQSFELAETASPSSLCKELYCAFIMQFYKLRISSQALIHLLILGFGPKNILWPFLLSFMARNNLYCKETLHKSLGRSCVYIDFFLLCQNHWVKFSKQWSLCAIEELIYVFFLRVDQHSSGRLCWMGFLNQSCCSCKRVYCTFVF